MANGKSEGGFSRTTVSQQFVINGKEYAALEDMPADVRARYEKLMSGMGRDENGNGIPDMFEQDGVFPNLAQMMKTEGPVAMKSFSVGGGPGSAQNTADIKRQMGKALFSLLVPALRGMDMNMDGDRDKETQDRYVQDGHRDKTPPMPKPSVSVREDGHGSLWNWIIPLAVIAGIIYGVFAG